MKQGIMAGVMPQPAQQQQQQQVVSPEQQEQSIPPEQQAELMAFTENAREAIFSEGSRDELVDILKQDRDIVERLTVASLIVYGSLAQSKAKSGKGGFNDIILGFGWLYIIQELIDLAEMSGVTEDITAEQVQAAHKKALKQHIGQGIADGTLDPQQLQERLNEMVAHHGIDVQAIAQNEVSEQPPQEEAKI